MPCEEQNPINLSAFSLIANWLAMVSVAKLKLSPVTETAIGPINTIEPRSN